MNSKILNASVVVSALGYFVDIYDLLLFSIVRVASLRSLGVAEEDLLSQGVYLINMQMTGLLLGGILWGIWGDKKGRLSVLFGSILLYSLANLANAFVTTVPQYGWLRLIAGIGLAGELGAAITLVSETMSIKNRGYGTTIVAGFGILGAVFAGVLSEYFTWQQCYIIGGVMGLLLLILRVSVIESGMFHHVREQKDIRRGDLKLLFSSQKRLLKYASCVLIGLPIWFVIGILMTFSPELAQALGVIDPVSAGRSIMYSYAGLSLGDFACGFISQKLHSRKKVIFYTLLLAMVLSGVYLNAQGIDRNQFYVLCGFLGFSVGYWAVFVTTAAEQFGTNLRATVTTTVPNFVRGSVVPLTLAFQGLIATVGIINSAMLVGSVCFLIAFYALFHMEETYGKDLNFIEE